MNAEAYVLFYRKNSMRIEPLREEVQTYLDQGSSLVQFYISRQWLNKFENFAEPGMSQFFVLRYHVFWFLTEEIQYHDGLRSRELGQAPILLCAPNS